MKAKIKKRINLDEGWAERRAACAERRMENAAAVARSLLKKKLGIPTRNYEKT